MGKTFVQYLWRPTSCDRLKARERGRSDKRRTLRQAWVGVKFPDPTLGHHLPAKVQFWPGLCDRRLLVVV